MEMKNVLAIQASYRKTGKTAAMLKYAVEAAESKGHKVTTVNLFDMNIDYCKGCMKCDDAHECIFKKDDMPALTKLIKEADVIIFAAPVYWGNVPAILKNMFDRLRGASMEETKTFPKPRLAGKRYILLTACNTVMPFARWCGQSSGIRRVVKEYCKTSGIKEMGMVVCDNSNKVEEVPKKKLEKIEKLVGRI